MTKPSNQPRNHAYPLKPLARVGSVLRCRSPGQPSYPLVLLSPTRFRLSGDGVPDAFFVDYTLEAGV